MRTAFLAATPQAFIGVTARHEVMRTYLRYLLQYYQGTRNLTDVNPHLGVQMLQRAYDDCCRATMNATTQILAEARSSNAPLLQLLLKHRLVQLGSSLARAVCFVLTGGRHSHGCLRPISMSSANKHVRPRCVVMRDTGDD